MGPPTERVGGGGWRLKAGQAVRQRASTTTGCGVGQYYGPDASWGFESLQKNQKGECRTLAGDAARCRDSVCACATLCNHRFLGSQGFSTSCIRTSQPGPPLEPGQLHSRWVSLQPETGTEAWEPAGAATGPVCSNSSCPRGGELARGLASIITQTNKRFPGKLLLLCLLCVRPTFSHFPPHPTQISALR